MRCDCAGVVPKTHRNQCHEPNSSHPTSIFRLTTTAIQRQCHSLASFSGNVYKYASAVMTPYLSWRDTRRAEGTAPSLERAAHERAMNTTPHNTYVRRQSYVA